ncbi:hypothetical protein [Streptomyces sp. NPDC059708]|uniref:hypothetical protein n=1 Tax=Streptomyces sp. NPDC059708 TaxID=3346916 RepID=UPI0036B62A7E
MSLVVAAAVGGLTGEWGGPRPAAGAGRDTVAMAAADGGAEAQAHPSDITTTADNDLYVLAADHSAVWRRRGTDWEAISGGPVSAVYAGHLGVFMVLPGTGLIYKYKDDADRWDPIGSGKGKFAVSGDSLYRLADDGVSQWRGDEWHRIGPPAKDIYAGGAGLFATDPVSGVVRKYDGEPESWSYVGGPGAAFAVSDNHLYGLAPDHSGVYEWNGKEGSRSDWTRVGWAAKDIYAGGAGLFATDRVSGVIRKYDGEPDSWSYVGEPGAAFAVSDNHLYGLTPDRSEVYQWNGKEGGGADWSTAGSGLPAAPGRANQSPYWNKTVKCSQKDPDGRVIPTRTGNHLFGWTHFSGPHNIRKCEIINKALSGKVDKVDGTRLEYLGYAVNGMRQVKIKVIVQYAQTTIEENKPYDAGPGQRIGVITAYCVNVPNNKCPNWVNE